MICLIIFTDKIFYDQTTTFSYYDVLAFSDKSNKLIKKVIEDYVAS